MSGAKQPTEPSFGQRLAAKMFKTAGGKRVELHMAQQDLAMALDVAYAEGMRKLLPLLQETLRQGAYGVGSTLAARIDAAVKEVERIGT